MTGPPTPFHIAIVGSGPSGFYAAEALFRSGLDVAVDMFEKLPTPFGLVRSGVAPDHQKLKQPIQVFDGIAREPRFTFVGNVSVGAHITVEELRSAYHAVIFACGAQVDRRMDIPGEDLVGSHTATEFVGWYNGHPDFRDRTFDLDQEVVAIIGQGNVAVDVCRILMRPVADLKTSDIAEHALDALSRSRVREVHIIGRRGPVQAKFTSKELRELASLPSVSANVEADELILSEACKSELASASKAAVAKNFEIFQSLVRDSKPDAKKRIHFRFLASPVAIRGCDKVEGISLVCNHLAGLPSQQIAIPTDKKFDLPCGLVFRSIGYKGLPIAGLPFDDLRGVVPNEFGRITSQGGAIPGLFVTGWLKRGPSGVIGTNRADSLETVDALLKDLSQGEVKLAPGLGAILPVIQLRTEKIVRYADWLNIDASEVERGKVSGKPREKFTRVEEMLSHVT